MKKMCKKVVSLLLAAVMVLTMTAFASVVYAADDRSKGSHCEYHHCCKKKADNFFTHFVHFTSSLIFLFAFILFFF